MVHCCGNNEAGQLGVASRSVQFMPIQVDSFEQRCKMIACGVHHTLVLTKEGQIYGFGSNMNGELGVETQHTMSINPVLIKDISHINMSFIAAGSFSASVALDTGSLYLWGTGTFGEFSTPHRVKKIKERAQQVSIGDNFGVVLTEDN